MTRDELLDKMLEAAPTTTREAASGALATLEEYVEIGEGGTAIATLSRFDRTPMFAYGVLEGEYYFDPDPAPSDAPTVGDYNDDDWYDED